MEKRYALVRVDDRCPVENEEEIYLVDRVKMFPCFLDKRLSCKNCNYGDTKEQLIKKVAQEFVRITKELQSKKLVMISAEGIAQRIVEFLGVEE